MGDGNRKFSLKATIMDETEAKEEIGVEMAQDYSTFSQVDFSEECHKMDIAVEDMLAKLEEFGSLMEMMSECSGTALSEMVPRVFAARQRLQQLFQRVDAMEAFVTAAGGQLCQLEEQVDRAEKHLAAPGSLTHTFSALFQNKRTDVAQEPPAFSPPDIFSSEDYFHRRTEPRGVPE